MSIIVVVKKNGRAVIAADTAQTDDTLRVPAHYVSNHSKILQVGDSWLGLAGWSVLQDILEAVTAEDPAAWSFAGRRDIFATAVRLHQVFKKRYFVDPNEEKDQPVESSQLAALIANGSGIFELESYRSVIAYERFWALGSGKALALGAMHAAWSTSDDAEAIARAGINAACEFDDGCALPLELHNIALDQPV